MQRPVLSYVLLSSPVREECRLEEISLEVVKAELGL